MSVKRPFPAAVRADTSPGGGFNVTLEVLRDRERRSAITSKIRECAACVNNAADILNENLGPA